MAALAVFATLPGLTMPCFGQLHFGFKGGIPLNRVFEGGTPTGAGVVPVARNIASRASGNWVVGPTAELHLPFGLGVEANALYRRYEVTQTQPGVAEVKRAGGSWEFPLLAKVRIPAVVVQPYLGAGIHFQNLRELPAFFGQPTTNRFGSVLAAGISLPTPGAKLSGEIRYSRFNDQTLPAGRLGATNQFDVLIGLTF